MKGKRYKTEQKIRIVREGQRSAMVIVDVCRAHKRSAILYSSKDSSTSAGSCS